METEFASTKAGGRHKLAEMLGVALITTYQKSWNPNLPPKHERFLQAARPKWFKEWEAVAQQWRDAQQKASML